MVGSCQQLLGELQAAGQKECWRCPCATATEQLLHSSMHVCFKPCAKRLIRAVSAPLPVLDHALAQPPPTRSYDMPGHTPFSCWVLPLLLSVNVMDLKVIKQERRGSRRCTKDGSGGKARTAPRSRPRKLPAAPQLQHKGALWDCCSCINAVNGM